MSISISDAIWGYRKLKNQIADIKAAQAKDPELVKAQANFKGFEDLIMAHLKSDPKMKSYRTENGTASLTTRVTKSVEDWDAVKNFVKENDCMEILYKNVSTPAVKEWEEEHGRPVDGVATNSFLTLSVRAPTKKLKSLKDE